MNSLTRIKMPFIVGALALTALSLITAYVVYTGLYKQWYMHLRYNGEVNHYFAEDFKAVNQYLQEKYAVTLTRDPEISGCDQGYRYVSGCREQAAAKLAVDDTFIRNWQSTSPELEKFILDQGWEKTGNAAQPIDELFHDSQRKNTIGVNYVKKHGETTCSLEVAWVTPGLPEPLTIRQSCEAYRTL